MSKGKRYTQEFKIEAVKQITERDYSVAIRINRRANRGVAALEHQKRLNHHHYSLMT
jgi:transposase-like protein